MTAKCSIFALLFLAAAVLPSCARTPVRDGTSGGKHLIFVIDVAVKDYSHGPLSRTDAGTINFYSDNTYSAAIKDPAVRDRVLMSIGRAMSATGLSRDDLTGQNEALLRQRAYVRAVIEKAEGMINKNGTGTFVLLRCRDRR